MAGFDILPSQFITTYGVGSIIETAEGPRIIKNFSRWGRHVFAHGVNPDIFHFDISPPELEQVVGGRLFRIPTNSELHVPPNTPIFGTGEFPHWGLCPDHENLYELKNGCSDCHREGNPRGRKQATRFIAACTNGHLDDVDWMNAIPHRPKCSSRSFSFVQRGAATAKETVISCRCGANTSLDKVYEHQQKIHCRGVLLEKNEKENCDKYTQIVLRGSASVRIPQVETIIAIPGPKSPDHECLSTNSLQDVLSTKKEWTKDELVESMENMMVDGRGNVDTGCIDRIRQIPDDKRLNSIIDDIKNIVRKQPKDINEQRGKEFATLQNAALNGHPPDQALDPHFFVSKPDVKKFPLGSGEIRVTPIDSLRVLTYQKGYYRISTDTKKSKLVETYYEHNNARWYPGNLQISEGIFIDDGGKNFGVSSKEWSTAGFGPKEQSFTFWHTLSHLLTKSVSINSGYSSTAIREVVYIKEDERSGDIRGGILLYTTQGGGDGTLGGLVSLVPEFDHVIEYAVRDLDFCSNDPLCSEQKIGDTQENGAACFACCKTSETSCSYFNKSLDRILLRDAVI